MIRFQVMATGIDKVQAEFGKLESKAAKAEKRAIKRTIKGVQTQLVREVAKKTGIAQKHLKKYNRVKSRTSRFNSYLQGEFWMGINPMPAHTSSGKARQEDWGVRKGRYLFDGAFYRSVFGPQAKIWFRKNSRGARQNIGYHRKRRSHQSAWQRQNSSRFPVVLAGIGIEKQAKAAFGKIGPAVASTFQNRLIHEMKYELSK